MISKVNSSCNILPWRYSFYVKINETMAIWSIYISEKRILTLRLDRTHSSFWNVKRHDFLLHPFSSLKPMSLSIAIYQQIFLRERPKAFPPKKIGKGLKVCLGLLVVLKLKNLKRNLILEAKSKTHKVTFQFFLHDNVRLGLCLFRVFVFFFLFFLRKSKIFGLFFGF